MKADEKFEKIDFRSKILDREYDNCVFESCIFSNADLSEISFLECEFRDCDLTLANLSGTGLKDVKFVNCKMLGMNFKDAAPFLLQIHLNNCHLEESSFYRLDLKGSSFDSCKLMGADFSEADLQSTPIVQCDLSECTFEGCNLTKADFTGSFNCQIDPEKNRLKGARFSRDQLHGLLWKYGIQVEN